MGWRDLGIVQELLEKGRKRKRSPALNCSLLKKMELCVVFSVDVGSPSTNWIEMPFGMKKRSWNSNSLRSLVGFLGSGRPELMTVRPPFPPYPITLDEVVSFFAGILERWAEPNLHGTVLIVRKQPPDPTI